MRGTRLDYLMAIGLLIILVVVIALAVNPIHSLSVARDSRRSDDVRKIMTSILTLSQQKSDKYDALLHRLKANEGEKYLLGTGSSCAGNWGRFCPTDEIADNCLPPEEIFATPEDAPVDPSHALFGTFGTGYYVTAHDDMIEVGSCGADTGIIQLQTFAP
jgi:hypothetical protein